LSTTVTYLYKNDKNTWILFAQRTAMIRSKIAMGFFWGWLARLGFLALALHLAAGVVAPLYAQGTRKDDIVFNSRGVPLAGATVRVCTMPASGQPCTPLAQIFSDSALTQALANPTTTDGLGNYFFYAAPGKYEIEFSGPGITTKQIPNVLLPSDPNSPSFSTVSSTGAITAFSLNLTGNLTVNGNTTVVGNLASGTLNLTNQSTPPGAGATGTVNVYTKTADKRLYYKDDTGTEIGPIANTTGAQTNVTNTFTASQNFDGDIHFKGPNPSFDILRYGGYANTTLPAPSTTCSITSGQTSATCASAIDFANGQGIVIYGAGPVATVTTPGTPTVTPAGILNGATTYNYKVVAEDRSGGLTAASAQGSATTGAATLGVNTVTVTQGARVGGLTTYTTSAAHNFQAGSTVSVNGFNTGSGTFFDDMNGTKVIVSAPTSTTFTVQDGSLTDRTDTSTGTASVQACNTLTYASGSYGGASTLRYWIYRNNALVGVAPGLDPYFSDCGLTVGGAPSYVPSAPPASAAPEYLVSTIVSGGGTTSLTLANSAGATVTNAAALHDNSLALKAAAQAAYNNQGGTVYIPSGNGYLPFNATTDFMAGLSNTFTRTVRILVAGGMILNQTIILRSGMDFEGAPSQWGSFVYTPGAFISGNAHPMIYVAPLASGLHLNRLLLQAGPVLQTAFMTDVDATGSGSAGINFDSVYFMGNNATTRPVILKGGFDYFFAGGVCSGGNAVWPQAPCIQITNSSAAVTGSNGSQVPGRIVFDRTYFVNTGVQIDDLPNANLAGVTHIRFDKTLYESALYPLARINFPGAYISQIVFNDVLGADLSTGVGTPFIDGTNSTNLQVVDWFGGSLTTSAQPLLINGTPGNPTTLFVERPPSGFVGSGPWIELGTQIAEFNNANVFADNGGRIFYRLNFPAAPQSLTLSAGGSVPVGTMTYAFTAVDGDGKETAMSNPLPFGGSASINVTSGNQTVNITAPASFPTGAVGLNLYRFQPGNGPGKVNITSCFTPEITIPGQVVSDNSGFTCSAPPALAGAGAANLSSNGVTTYKLNIASESLTASPRGEQNIFLPGALTTTWTAGTWTPDKAVTVTRVQAQAKTAPSGCTTNAVVRLTDGTTPVNLTISAAANDSGAIAQNYAAAVPLVVSVQTAASGCATSPADANVIVQYKMQ
jgi:hypothetical protein